MPELLTEDGQFTDEFRTGLPGMLGLEKMEKDDGSPIKTFDDFKDITGLVKSHQDLRTSYDKKQENVIQRPADDADDTAKTDFVKLLQKELGAPDTATDYDMAKLTEGDSPMLPKEAAEKLAEVFHTHGASKATVAAVIETYAELSQAAINQQAETETKAFNEATAKYQTDLPGDKGTVHTRSAIDAMRKFNANNPEFLKLLDESKFYDNPSDLSKLKALGMSMGDMMAWGEIAKELGVSHAAGGPGGAGGGDIIPGTGMTKAQIKEKYPKSYKVMYPDWV